MSTDSLADPLDRHVPPRRVSLRWRVTLAVPVVTGLIVAAFEWSLGGVGDEGVAHLAWLVLLLTVAQLLLIEALLLRPLGQLATGFEAMESAPVPLMPEVAGPAPGLATELDRISQAMQRARGSLWQQEQDARELRTELAQHRRLLKEAHASLEAQQREFASLVRTDTLTGVGNQRAFDEALRREFKRAQRQRSLLALAVLDLDHFKQFNSRHGSEAGDQALQRVAALLQERLKRDTDVVARLGGEQFAVLLPGIGMAEAQGVLELLRDNLRALHLPGGQGDLTLSVGLAAASPAHPYLTAQALLQAADEALYIAKHAGRDRLSLAA
ncbi:hypothetical protein DBR42_09290 [Pelomonas sp. HMWF004]|nr:hypothetical protein DBR42_09290 [Pelomonas sp. HMWF004]